jgi:hypothetical protein
MVNISRIGAVNDTMNHIMVMNDGENAAQFMNIIRMRIAQLKASGERMTKEFRHDVVQYALQKVNLLPDK